MLHQTAREFLLDVPLQPTEALHTDCLASWHGSIRLDEANFALAEVCMDYLNLEEFATESYPNALTCGTAYCKSLGEIEIWTTYPLRSRNVFLGYSAENWAQHFRKAAVKNGAAIVSFAQRLCTPGISSFGTWFAVCYDLFEPGRRNYCYVEGTDALMVASMHGLTQVAEVLATKETCTGKNKEGGTALHFAVANGFEEVARVLLRYGADVNGSQKASLTPLHHAVLQRNHELIAILLEKGAEANRADEANQTALYMATTLGDTAAAQQLLKHGAAWSCITQGEMSGHKAAFHGNIELIQLLLEWGMPIDQPDEGWRNTMLHHAAAAGHIDLATFLMDRGAGVNLVDMGGDTPLLRADYISMVRVLIDGGAIIDHVGCGGQTILHRAATLGHLDVARFLVEEGIAIDAKDEDGRIPLDYAQENLEEMVGTKPWSHAPKELLEGCEEAIAMVRLLS